MGIDKGGSIEEKHALVLYKTQHTGPQDNFLTVPQCSSWYSDRNTSTANHRSAVAVEYEHIFRMHPKIMSILKVG